MTKSGADIKSGTSMTINDTNKHKAANGNATSAEVPIDIAVEQHFVYEGINGTCTLWKPVQLT